MPTCYYETVRCGMHFLYSGLNGKLAMTTLAFLAVQSKLKPLLEIDTSRW